MSLRGLFHHMYTAHSLPGWRVKDGEDIAEYFYNRDRSFLYGSHLRTHKRKENGGETHDHPGMEHL